MLNCIRLLLLMVTFACDDSKSKMQVNSEVPLKNPKQTLLIDLQPNFKYNNLKAFEIDTFSWETRPGNYHELDSLTFKLIWQDGTRQFIGKDYDRDYFYSWQNRSKEFIELVVLTQDVSSYCDILHYIIFEKNGKEVDNFIVGAQCGDGGWVYNSSGKFISPDTYQLISIETESEVLATDTNKEIVAGDSVITHFTIGNNGNVMKKEVSKFPIRKEL